MANKVKKVLIIGDSNCLPRIISKKISVNLEDTYIFKLKKKLKSDKVEQVVWGGLTTTQLSNFAISYYQKWKPDFIIIHSGINDVKNQFISNNSLKILYKFFSLFKISKKKFKDYFLYNPNLIKYHSNPKVEISLFKEQIFKIKSCFKKSKIIYIGIHSNNKIDKERPNTHKIINYYNNFLKNEFNELFIDDSIFNKNKDFIEDGYHLNKVGHLKLYNNLLKTLKLN